MFETLCQLKSIAGRYELRCCSINFKLLQHCGDNVGGSSDVRLLRILKVMYIRLRIKLKSFLSF